MGQITYEGDYVASNPELAAIIATAAASSPYDVVYSSGYRQGDPRQHGKKNAIDVKLVDPATGKAVPNYQSAQSFRAYEEFAQVVRTVQRRDYPEMSNKLRWGGYFSGSKGKYGALDLMHFDMAGDKLGMAGGSWDKGLTSKQRTLFPGVVSVGLNDHPVPQALLSNEAPKPANLTRGLDQKRIEFAQNAAPPVPATMSPALAAARQRLSAARETKVASLDTSAPSRSVVPSYTPNLNIPSGSNVPKADVGYNPALQAHILPDARNELIQKIASTGQTSVKPAGFDALDMAMAPARQVVSRPTVTKQPVPKPPVSVRVPTGPTQDPVGNGASLLDLKKFNPQPAPPVVKTAGIAGTVQMPSGARPSSVPPAPLVPPTMVQHSGSRDSVAQAAAGRASGAALATPPQVAGNALSIAPPIPHTMSPGLRGNTLTAASSPSPAALPASRAPAAPAPKFYQSGGYIYAANPTGGGYQKVGKVGGGTPSSSSSSGGGGGNDYFKQMTTA